MEQKPSEQYRKECVDSFAVAFKASMAAAFICCTVWFAVELRKVLRTSEKRFEPYVIKWLGSLVVNEPTEHGQDILMWNPRVEIGCRSDGVIVWRIRETNTVTAK